MMNSKLLKILALGILAAGITACDEEITATGGNVGEPCVVDTYVDGCNANSVKYCDNGVIAEFDCGTYAALGLNLTCNELKADGKHYADCVSPEFACDTADAKENSCEMSLLGEFISSQAICAKSITDEKNYWIVTEETICETADGKLAMCNDEGTACTDKVFTGFYSCTNEDCSEEGDGSLTCGKACADNGLGNDAWCDMEGYVYCEDPATMKSELDKNSCNITDLSSIVVLGSCTEANLECEAHVCNYDKGDNYEGYYTDYVMCLDMSEYGEDGLMWYPVEGFYTECNNQCDASKQACDDKGGLNYAY